METNLIENDIDIFLDKYTRFITKNIYISKYLYNNFMDSYNYLFEELEKNIFLYENTNKYKKVKKILDNKDKLLKHHNQNYLKDTLLKYNNYFDNIYSKEELDINKRKIILSEENNILVINNKNNIPLICMKIDYLIKIKKYKEEDILVLINDDDLYQDLQEELGSKFNYTKVQIYTTIEYGKKIIKDNYKLISTSDEFNIIVDYIKNILFKDKELFNKLYVSFSNKIYLNKDFNLHKVEVYGNDIVKIKFQVEDLDLKAGLSTDLFDLKKYVQVEETDCKDEECTEKQTMGSIETAIYPLYMPSETYLSSSETVNTDDNSRIILTYSGGKNFVLVEEGAIKSQEHEIIPVYGEPVILNDTIAALSTNSIYWTSNNIDYYMASEDLSLKEMISIASSMNNSKNVVSLK